MIALLEHLYVSTIVTVLLEYNRSFDELALIRLVRLSVQVTVQLLSREVAKKMPLCNTSKSLNLVSPFRAIVCMTRDMASYR